jgi:hypothetical protein
LIARDFWLDQISLSQQANAQEDPTPMKSEYCCESRKHPARPAILECPECFSHRAEVLDTQPIRARCFDCTATYPFQTVNANPEDHCKEAEEQGPQRKRAKTKADYRAEITPAPPLSPEELGPNTLFMQEVIRATPEEVAKAEHVAQKYSAKFGQEFEATWFLETEWLTKLKSVHRVRARAALRWRPKFLAALAIGRTMVFACKAANVAYNTAKYHRAQDRQFDEQCLAAMDYAGELLESRAFQRALEGDVEPIVYMGVVVGHIRKFDSRLQIELLRAYQPGKFKTPGANVNIATKSDIFVLTEEQRHELQRINREWLLSTPIESDPPSLRHGGIEQRETLTPNDRFPKIKRAAKGRSTTCPVAAQPEGDGAGSLSRR